MSHETPILKPTAATEELPREIIDLVEAVAHLPAEHHGVIEPILSRVVESTKRRRRILSLVQDALGQLRLDMKYLAFDLEATRRERDDYRRKVEEQGYSRLGRLHAPLRRGTTPCLLEFTKVQLLWRRIQTLLRGQSRHGLSFRRTSGAAGA